MSIPPVVKTLHVGLVPQAAFELFTARIAEWWPTESHSVSSQDGKASRSLLMIPGVGGTLVEIAHDGTSHIWGEIKEWSPGQAFAMSWHPGRTDGVETHLSVTFEAKDGGTLLKLTHSNWEALGASAAKTRDGYDGGWNGVLERLDQVA